MNKNKVLSNAFTWLFIGLLVCFATSFTINYSQPIRDLIYGAFDGLGYIIYLIIEVVVALILVIRIRKLSPLIAKILYILYTALTGLSLSGIAYVYTGSSIASVFLITAIIFGIFAIIGKTTKVDLTKWSIYLLIAIIAIFILEIINIFILNSTLNIILCIVSILVFCMYIAYDIQLALRDDFLGDTKNKGIYIAFQLFVDFINLFLRLLELFGKNNRD